MDPIRQNVAGPQTAPTLNQLAQQQAVGLPSQPGPLTATPAQLAPTDSVSQQSGSSGRALATASLSNTSFSNSIKRLVAKGDFEALKQMLINLDGQDLGQLDLSRTELDAIAQGFGRGGMVEQLPLVDSIPMLGGFDGDEKAIMARLIQASGLSADQKYTALVEFSGADHLQSFLRSSNLSELRDLSGANRASLLNQLSPQGEIGGLIEEGKRRAGLGDDYKEMLVSKLLRSAANETELLSLFSKMSTWNTDDLAYRYILDLGAQELGQLSDNAKLKLLQMLTDTEVTLPMLNFRLDLNDLGNIDEVLGMTSEAHVQVAKMLVRSMSQEMQNSAEVAKAVSRSDQLTAQLSQLQDSLQQAIQDKSLSQESIAQLRADGARIKERFETEIAQLQGVPGQEAEVQKLQRALDDAQAFTQSLIAIEQNLGMASELNAKGISSLNQAEAALAESQAHLETTQNAMEGLERKLTTLGNQMETAQGQLWQKYTQIAATRAELGQMGQAYDALLAQMQSTLNTGTVSSENVQQLAQLNARLQQMETQLQQNPGQSALFQRIDHYQQEVSQSKASYESTVSELEQSQADLERHSADLAQHLDNYERHLQTLESGHSEARAHFNGLNPEYYSSSQIDQWRAELDDSRLKIASHRDSLESMKTSLREGLLPGAAEVEAAQKRLAPAAAALEEQINHRESQAAALEVLQEETQGEFQIAARAHSQLRSRVNEVYSSVQALMQGQGVNALSMEQLNAVRGEIEGLLTTPGLNQAPDVDRSQLSELQSILAQVQSIDRHLARAESVSSDYSDALAHLEQRKAMVSGALTAAQSAEAQAAERLLKAQQDIQQAEVNLQALGIKLNEYQETLERFETQLAQTDSSNEGEKLEFLTMLQEMREEQGLAPKEGEEHPGKPLYETFQQNQQSRDEIRRQIVELQALITQTEQAMRTEKSTLNQNYLHLSEQSQALQDARETVLLQQGELARIQSENQSLQRTSQELLASLGQEIPQALRSSVAELQERQSVLEQTQSSLSAQLHSGQSSLDSLILLQRQIRDRQSSLQTQATKVDDFMTGKLSNVKSLTQNIGQKFVDYETASARVNQKLEDLLNDIRSAGSGLDLEQMEARAMEIYLETDDPETLRKLERLGAAFDSIKELMAQGAQSSQVLGAVISNLEISLDRADSSIQSFETSLAEIEGRYREAQAQVDGSESRLLQSQRDLLARRRELGIQSQSYQQALMRYEALLQQDSLNPADLQEVRGLEQILSGIEAQQMEDNGALQDEIVALNALKAQVSADTRQLRENIRALNQVKQELTQQRPELIAARQTLQQDYRNLKSERDIIFQQIQELRQHAQEVGGVEGVQALLAQFESELAEIDQKLAEMELLLQQSDTVLGRLDETVVRIDFNLLKGANLLATLEMLMPRLEALEQEYKNLLGLSEGLLDDLKSLKADQTELLTAGGNIKSPENAPVQGGGESTQGASEDSRRRARNPLSSRLSQDLISFWSEQRRTEAQERDRDFQSQRDAFHALLMQQIESTQILGQELQARIREQDDLERAVESIIQNKAQGIDSTSILNVVGAES